MSPEVSDLLKRALSLPVDERARLPHPSRFPKGGRPPPAIQP